MKIATIIGARPQFIKAAPVSRAITEHNKSNSGNPIEEILVHTGQHYDDGMSGIFLRQLEIPGPKYHLGIGSGTHGDQTGRMLMAIEQVLLDEWPDWVLIYGDTNSTLAGALAAAKLHIPVAHVEAGLRSFNKKMPEELNRVLADHVSNLLFCPTEAAVDNLRREGFTNIVNNGKLLSLDEVEHISEGDFHRGPIVLNVGDVMYDAVLQYSEFAEKKSNILECLKLKPKSYALATVHRAENTDDPERLKGIFQGLIKLVHEGLKVVFPLHPRTRKALVPLSLEEVPDALLLIEPVSYLDMLILEKSARVILTDSGGVQKEAFFFRVPCVTLREETEWVETVETGWNVLVGYDPERIYRAALEAQPGVESVWPYGDGQAGERIVQWLKI